MHKSFTTNQAHQWEVAKLTWDRLETLARQTIGLLPVGAACKEHGYHLPLGTDAAQVQWLCSELAKRTEVLVWPTVHYGYYPAFREFPGSPSVDRDCFEHTLIQVLNSMERSGHRCCIIVNSGISTINSVERVCHHRHHPWHIYSGAHYRQTGAELAEQNHGGHADELETSLMLYIARETVNQSAAVPVDKPFTPGILNRSQLAELNYTPSGGMGNPSLGTESKGRRLAEAMLEDGLEFIRRVRPL